MRRTITALLAAPLLLAGALPAYAINPLNLRDVPTSDPDYTAIRYLNQHDVLYGYLNGNMYPDRTVTRAELLKIAIEGSGHGVDAIKTDALGVEFSDVPASHTLRSYILFASSRGDVSGYPDGTFRPNASVTRAEASKILLNIFEGHGEGMLHSPYTDIQSSTLVSYIEQLYRLDWFRPAGTTFRPNAPILRREVAHIAFRAIHSRWNEGRGPYDPTYDPQTDPVFMDADSDWRYVGDQVQGAGSPPRASIPAGWHSTRSPEGAVSPFMGTGPTQVYGDDDLTNGGLLFDLQRTQYQGTDADLECIYSHGCQVRPTVTRVFMSGSELLDVYELSWADSSAMRRMYWRVGSELYTATFKEGRMPSQLGTFYRFVQGAAFLNGSYGY